MTTSFDRAAPFYDDTRGLSAETITALTDRIAEGIGAGREVLELGVGTGRVAVPLSERGYLITGVDVSRKMVSVLDGKCSAVKSRIADATDLPFRDSEFDAVLAVDFFHLVSGWRRVVDEAVRVLRTGGRIVLSAFTVVDDPTIPFRERLSQQVGQRPRPVGIDIAEVLVDLENRFGATTVKLAAVPHRMSTSLAEELNGLRNGHWSRYWHLGDDTRHRAADKIEADLRAANAALIAPLEIQLNQEILCAKLPES